jgi:enamine deaminase RidA (YjgF/YER057c/UK114 family)
MPERGPGRACGLVEVDQPFLGGDEHGDRGGELRHRRPGETELGLAICGLDPAAHTDGHMTAVPTLDLPKGLQGTDTMQMARLRISSGAAFEDRVGYSRAVRAGNHVWVSGTAPIMPGDADPPEGAYEQAGVCLGIIKNALEQAGASLDDVVRTRIYVTDASLIDEVGRAHGEAFAAARPATTGIVSELLDPRWLVEIEAEAIID